MSNVMHGNGESNMLWHVRCSVTCLQGSSRGQPYTFKMAAPEGPREGPPSGKFLTAIIPSVPGISLEFALCPVRAIENSFCDATPTPPRPKTEARVEPGGRPAGSGLGGQQPGPREAGAAPASPSRQSRDPPVRAAICPWAPRSQAAPQGPAQRRSPAQALSLASSCIRQPWPRGTCGLALRAPWSSLQPLAGPREPERTATEHPSHAPAAPPPMLQPVWDSDPAAGARRSVTSARPLRAAREVPAEPRTPAWDPRPAMAQSVQRGARCPPSAR
nr:uncharacterized protein LOC127484635 [Oryctolagus cuniculus]